MATYNLRLDSVESRVDGNVKLDMWVLDDNLSQQLHKDVLIPYTAIETALASPTTGAKTTAVKGAIWEYRNNSIPVVENTSEWEFELLEALIGSVNQAAALNSFITDTLSLSFPFNFTITG